MKAKLRFFVTGALTLATTLLAGTLFAQTKTELGLDLDFVHPIAESGATSGGGGALRFGQQLDLIALSFTGEIVGTYHAFGGADNPRLYSGLAGGRISLGKVLEPGVFLHVGGGHLSSDSGSSWSPLFDAGLFLDLTIFPLLDIGIHGTYVHLFSNSKIDTFEYVVVGPHAAMIF